MHPSLQPASSVTPSLPKDIAVCNKHSGGALMGRRPMNQVPLAWQELSSQCDGTFLSLFPLPCFPWDLSIPFHFFSFLLFFFSEPWLPLKRSWEVALRDMRNSTKQACCYIPARHPKVIILPTLPGCVYIKERVVDVTRPKNRLTHSRKKQRWRSLGRNQYGDQPMIVSAFAEEILRIGSDLGVVYTGLKS